MLHSAINAVLRILNITITLEGFTFSLLDLFIFMAVGFLIAYFIGRTLS